MSGVEGSAEEAVAAAVGLVELVAWVLVVAVVREATEVAKECEAGDAGSSPLGPSKRRGFAVSLMRLGRRTLLAEAVDELFHDCDGASAD